MKKHSAYAFPRITRNRLLSVAALLMVTGILVFVQAGSHDSAQAAFLSTDAALEEDAQAAVQPAASSSDDSSLRYENTPITSFRVSNLSPQVTSDLDYVDLFFSQWEDCRYIFLPATANRQNLIISYAAGGQTVYLNDQAVQSGAQTNLLATADTFTLRVGNTEYGEVRVMQSNLGCVYISTSHGGLTYLDTHKTYTETGSTLILDADGKIQYSGDMEKLKSHGNSSWDYGQSADGSVQKRPYNLKLPEKANLYGMGKAKKWTLLGNYLDHSELRNAVAFSMAEQAGIEYTMDYVFVDLYSDGEYRGTYQLCERVQIQKNRVNITDLEEATEKLNTKALSEYDHLSYGAGLTDYLENSYKFYNIPNDPADITGGYLMQFQLYNRYGGTESGFVTSRGQAVDLKSPEYASRAQVEYIRSFMQDLEDAIYSETGYNSKGRHYSDYIDMDSLILYYLVEEITMDADGTWASFYFYKESDSKGDGKLHCAPVWDFDLGYINFIRSVQNGEGTKVFTSKPEELYIAAFPINGYDSDLTDESGSGNANTNGLGWIAMLYKNEDFVKRAAKLYYENYDAYLLELTDTSQDGGALITQMGEAIRPSAEMNNAATHMYGDREFRRLGPPNGNDFTECVDYIRSFLERRRNGLQSIWLAPFIEVRSEELQGIYDSIDLTPYDSEGQAELQSILENALSAITEAKNMDQAEAVFSQAQADLFAVPHAMVLGDFNDDLTVDVLDAQSLLMHYSKQLAGISEELTPTRERNGDVDANGRLDAIDAMHILRYASAKLANNVYTFPAEPTVTNTEVSTETHTESETQPDTTETETHTEAHTETETE